MVPRPESRFFSQERVAANDILQRTTSWPKTQSHFFRTSVTFSHGQYSFENPQKHSDSAQSYGNPTQIFQEDVIEERGENARLSAFVGAIAVGDLVKSTLGPKGMDKILQSA